MKIEPTSQYNVAMQGKNNNSWTKRLKQQILDRIPSYTCSSNHAPNKLNHYDDIISRPDVNRAIMGVSALATQPVFDYYNHKVDNETREVAKNRTIAKIVAGSAVGIFCVRGPLYKLIQTTTVPNGKSRYSKALLPQKYIEKLANNPKSLNNYRSALSMSLSLAVMLVTNFILDVPLTIFLTNILNKRSEKKGKISSSKEEIHE